MATASKSSIFDLRGDWRSIFHRDGSAQAAKNSDKIRTHWPVADTRCLDGLRGFFSVYILVFHTLVYMGTFANPEQFRALHQSGIVYSVIKVGLASVDGFFVLTGYLIAFPLFKSADRLHELSLKGYFWKRFVQRIYPPLVLNIILHCFLVFPAGLFELDKTPSLAVRSANREVHPNDPMATNSCNTWFLNLLFVNNFIPFGGCMGWTWSLAMQGQFYVVFPLLAKWLGCTRKLFYLLVFGLGLNVALRVATHILLEHEYAEAVVLYPLTDKEFREFLVMFWLYYTPTWNRMGPFILGALLAWLQTHLERPASSELTRVDRWANMLRSSPSSSAATASAASSSSPPASTSNQSHASHSDVSTGSSGSGTVLANVVSLGSLLTLLVVWALQAHWVKSIFHSVFVAIGGPLWNGALTVLLFFVINRVGPIGAWLARVLAHPGWLPSATLSYGVYLIQVHVLVKSYGTLLYPPAATSWALLGYELYSFITIYALAALAYVLVEQPAVRLLARYSPPLYVSAHSEKIKTR